jgi:hypothetical protein
MAPSLSNGNALLVLEMLGIDPGESHAGSMEIDPALGIMRCWLRAHIDWPIRCARDAREAQRRACHDRRLWRRRWLREPPRSRDRYHARRRQGSRSDAFLLGRDGKTPCEPRVSITISRKIFTSAHAHIPLGRYAPRASSCPIWK